RFRGRLGRRSGQVEAAELRRHDVPAAVGKGELRLPHPRRDRKGMKQDERAAPPYMSPRRRFEIAKSAYCGHDPIVNAPPPRVESEKPTDARPATDRRSAVARPRRPISVVPAPIDPCVCSAFSLARSTFTGTDRFARSNDPALADPLTV